MSTARSLNRVSIIGNLTRPPVLRKTGNGAVVGTFGVATNATWKDSDGNLQERAEFHNIVAWNKLAEICAQILNTGMLVYLDGELRTRAWNDENNKKHFRTEIKINDMKLLDAKDKKGTGMDVAFEAGENESDDYGDMDGEDSSTGSNASDDDDVVDEETQKEADDLF
ncbi:single-stranded DNA-binding protein [Candidatus Dojkabacteria bacterium]|uniref:Single-stranded DNA-binding protein n=1 Tax=Candidatus Dojkabacteria bacterium TaxID=2099670 RepID=A0A955RL48_9BACT|nr:single-stranded DNA-binding protein [Candidatus Dojkabacteria bacterium]